jgi:multidrug efflux system membrane fusion protein
VTVELEVRDDPDAARASIRPAVAIRSGRWRRAWIAGGVLLAGAAIYYGSGWFVAYTDDAYIQSDLVAMAPEVAGIIQSVAVQYNQRVNAGDQIATIDPRPYQLDVDLKQQRVASLRAAVAVTSESRDANVANLDTARAALEMAQSEFDRIATLARDHDVSQAELDRASDALKSARDARTVRQVQAEVNEREVTAAKAGVAVAQAELSIAQYALSRTRLTAPVDGYVNNLTLRPGDYVRVGEAVVGIVDDTRWRIIANFKEEVAASLATGTHVWVWLDSYPGRIVSGSVQGVGRGIARDPVAGGLLPYVAPTTDWIRLRRRFPVTIVFDPPPPSNALLMGADARVLLFR